MFKCIFAFLLLSLSPYLLADTITITNTNDSGTGSFRQAILDANTNIDDPDSIIFNIPKTDPNYIDSSGVWLIRPDSALPVITGNGVTIDGRSQAQFIGSDTNPYGPEIVLDGINAGANVTGIKIISENVRIWSLVIHNFSDINVWLYRSAYCQVAGCYIGTDVTGMKKAENSANGHYGINLYTSSHNHIGPGDNGLPGNVISGNNVAQIMCSNLSYHNTIIGNTIGLTADRKTGISYDAKGIIMQQAADSNYIAENYIGGNSHGIYFYLRASYNEFTNNFIGTDTTWADGMHNAWDGFQILGRSKNNLISENVIGKNGRHAINITDTLSTGNTCTRNCISENGDIGIRSSTGVITPPTVFQVTANSVSGTAPSNSQVEIYSDPEDEGRYFLGETTADASGRFVMNKNIDGEYITAIAIDDSGNTSEFSSAYFYNVYPDPYVTIDSGLVAYYPFHGNVNDESGNDNNGVLYGPHLTSDRFETADQAFYFDGIDDYIYIPDSLTLNPSNEMSVSAWIYLDSYKSNPLSNNIIVKDSYNLKRRDYLLQVGYHGTGNRASFGVFSNNSYFGLTSADSVNLQQWTHLAGTYDENFICIYIDGLLSSSAAYTGDINDSDQSLLIGATNDTIYNRYFHGKIDDIRIYNRAISSEEVNVLFTEPITIPVESENTRKPDQFILHQNYPNPFNPQTRIQYELKTAGVVELTVYDLLGNEVERLVNQRQSVGSHTVIFNAANNASGVYIYRIRSHDFVAAKKMILIR